MTSVVVEKIAEDMAKHLDAYRELIAKRVAFEERLQRAEKEKSTVKEAIFERVYEEYTAQIAQVEEDIEPLHEAMEKIRQEIEDSRNDIRSQIKEVEEKIEELGFRHRVGEYDVEAFSDREEPLRSRIEELTSQDDEFNRLLQQIDEAGQGPDNGTDAEEPTGDMQDSEYNEATDSDHEAIADVSAQKDESRSEERTNEVIDTSEWAMEFGMDRRQKSRRSDDTGDGAKAHRANAAAQETQAKKETSGMSATPVDDAPGADAAKTARGTAAGDSARLAGASSATTNTTATAVEMKKEIKNRTGAPILVVTQGPSAGKRVPLVPTTMTLGREHDNNIELKDEEVARYHARIAFDSGEYRIEDLDSSTGTWVNGNRIAKASLSHGDKIKLGRTEILINWE
jgi:hypothetical protein